MRMVLRDYIDNSWDFKARRAQDCRNPPQTLLNRLLGIGRFRSAQPTLDLCYEVYMWVSELSEPKGSSPAFPSSPLARCYRVGEDLR